MAKVTDIIAAVVPDYYCASANANEPGPDIGGFKKALRKNFDEAIKNMKDLKIKASSAQELQIVYDSTSETLEPIYFWLLDHITKQNYKVDKLVDNFTSAPGSGHFSELMGKATRMQEEAMKIMQTIGVLIKSVINIIYDLRQFQIRLRDYESAKSSDKELAKAGTAALKQIWMDNVDIKRGNTSIKALAFSQAAFATLIDAFMLSDSLKHLEQMDLNERVKNILRQRYIEFESWKELSEVELTKRFNLQKAWLKSQVDSIKMYTRWAKPYLVAAEQLRMEGGDRYNADVINVFNTILLQLTLIAYKELNTNDEGAAREIPEEFKYPKKKVYTCILVDLKFRGIPRTTGQHYVFGGRATITFNAYGLTKEEMDMVKYEIDKSDFTESLKLVSGMTLESLNQIQDDIDEFLLGKKPKEKEKAKSSTAEVNPFSALLGISGKVKKQEKIEETSAETAEKKKKEKYDELEKKGLKKDNYELRVIRELAEYRARIGAFNFYDIYKKAHGMASKPFADSWERRPVH